MLVTNHALAGGLLGLASRRPVIALPLAFATHLAMDRVPHWGAGPDRPLFLRVARTDGLLCLATLGALGAAAPRGRRLSVMATGLACVAPDLDKPGRHFAGRSPYPRWFDRFHAGLQDGREHRRLLRRELAVGAVLATAYAAAASAARRRPPAA
ncbi:MAG: hypothetical protein ACJ74O_20790 [Frankiaceae bacterium]